MGIDTTEQKIKEMSNEIELAEQMIQRLRVRIALTEDQIQKLLKEKADRISAKQTY